MHLRKHLLPARSGGHGGLYCPVLVTEQDTVVDGGAHLNREADQVRHKEDRFSHQPGDAHSHLDGALDNEYQQQCRAKTAE